MKKEKCMMCLVIIIIILVTLLIYSNVSIPSNEVLKMAKDADIFFKKNPINIELMKIEETQDKDVAKKFIDSLSLKDYVYDLFVPLFSDELINKEEVKVVTKLIHNKFSKFGQFSKFGRMTKNLSLSTETCSLIIFECFFENSKVELTLVLLKKENKILINGFNVREL